MNPTQYLNPITFEATYFSESLNKLSSNFNILDIHLIKALENVMKTIEALLESQPSAIVETDNTKFVKCDDLKYINRIYHCTRCKMDLGKSASKVALHIAENCGVQATPANATVEPSRTAVVANQKMERKRTREEERKQRKNQRIANVIKLKKKAKSLLSMNNTNIRQYLSDSIQIGDKLKCLPDYKDIENDLLALVKPLFPNKNVKLYMFGSRISGIGTRCSDLDIFIDIDGLKTFDNYATQATIKKLHKVRNAFKDRAQSWNGLVVIDKARVPILKVIHAKSSIECDISFSNCLGHANTQLMDYLFSLQPIARLMCIYMKRWLMRTGLTCEFSSYSMTLMVIFYLQQLKLLPPISKLFQNVDLETALFIGPWLATYVPLTLVDMDLELADTDNVMQFIEAFLKFYQNFDYENYLICPYAGVTIKKENFSTFMPSRYNIYVASDEDLGIALKRPMTIQDPIELNHNVTKGVNEFYLQVFKEYMVQSSQIISNANCI